MKSAESGEKESVPAAVARGAAASAAFRRVVMCMVGLWLVGNLMREEEGGGIKTTRKGISLEGERKRKKE